ncbi:MAG: acyl-CoA thioesterase domain-containing protein [Actinomycetota bacterium]
MTEHYFRNVDGALHPEPSAHGPWATDMLHGRLLGGVAARAIEADLTAELGPTANRWRVARLTVDLFRPAAMAPVTVDVVAVRSGRRVRVTDAGLHCDGHRVGRVTAVALPTGAEPPGTVWEPTPTAWPDPEAEPVAGADQERAGDAEVDGWLFRGVEGGFGTGQRTRVWTNDTRALVHGEPMSPLVRAAVSGDIACPLANSSDRGLHYINADYTMLIARYPVGPWVGLEVDHRMAADGIAVAAATLVDRDGPFATSGGTSLVRPPLEPND